MIWLLANSRGPFGEISHLWRELTSVNGPSVSGGASRLGSIASSRSAYWREALSVGEHHLLGGTGAGSFFPAHLRYSTAKLLPPHLDVKHAHSYVLDTFASFGLVGVVLNLGLCLAWCRDAARSVSARRHPGVGAGELDARWALIGAVIAFGVSSALDWTWYYPGVTVAALLAAGWIAGAAVPARNPTAQLAPAGPRGPAGAPRPRTVPGPGAIVALTALLALTLAVAWESLAPMRSTQSITASQTALEAQQGNAAESDARAAINEDPLSALAREQLATVYGAFGDAARERAELVKATQIQPDNPQPFLALGSYLLCSGDNDLAAVAPLRRATVLDITDSNQQAEALGVATAHQRPSATLCGELP